MKRKRSNTKRKPKTALAKETLETDAALAADYGLEDILSGYDVIDDETNEPDTNSKSVAEERTEHNVSSLQKKNSSVLGGLSKLAGSLASNQSRGNGSYAKFDSSVKTKTARMETNMTDRQADLEIEEAVSGRMQNCPNSLREMVVSMIKNMAKEAGGLTNLSRTVVGNEQALEPHIDLALEENVSLLRQGQESKEQELKAALMVIKKTMKLDAADPFNKPVDPIALGIHDYFDVIDTPMDFGTICDNLENGLKYMNSSDVYKDVKYIWDNCLKYNKKGDHILELMKRVKTAFMKYWIAAGLHTEQPPAIDETSVLRHNKQEKDCEDGPITDSPVQQHNEAGSGRALDSYPWPINFHAGQPGQSSTQAQSSTRRNEPDIDSSIFQTNRHGRGPTRCLKLLNTEGRITVATNELGQPIGPEASQLTSFLGLTARDGNLAPLTHSSWSKVPEENKEAMWQKVLMKFDIDHSSRSWVLASLASKWRNFKSLLKSIRYDTHATDAERLADRDERVLPEQWSALVSQWSSEKWQNISAKNKANRAQQKFNHTTGKKSFARIREEEKAKRPDGQEPSKAELFILTRTHKNGKPVNEETAAVISQLRESTAQQEASINRNKPQDDVYTQVMGQDRKGVPLQGLNATPARLVTEISTLSEAIKMLKEKNAEVLEMKEKLASVEQKCSQMADQMSMMVSMMATMQKSSLGEDIYNIGADALTSGCQPNQSTPISTSHHGVPSQSQQSRGSKKRR